MPPSMPQIFLVPEEEKDTIVVSSYKVKHNQNDMNWSDIHKLLEKGGESAEEKMLRYAQEAEQQDQASEYQSDKDEESEEQ